MKKILPVLIVIPLILAAGCSKAGPPLLKKGEKAVLWESFEQDLYWFAVGNSWGDGDSSLDALKVNKFATQGKYSFKGEYAMNGRNGAAYYVQDFADKDWTMYKGLGVDIASDAKEDISVALALCTGDAWDWQESPSKVVSPGKNPNIRFNFHDNTLKSQHTDWKHSASLADANDIKRVVLKFFGKAGINGNVYIDNIRLIK